MRGLGRDLRGADGSRVRARVDRAAHLFIVVGLVLLVIVIGVWTTSWAKSASPSLLGRGSREGIAVPAGGSGASSPTAATMPATPLDHVRK